MITKEDFDKLYSDDISKKEYDRIISLIEGRVQEIVRLIFPQIYKGRNWWDYSNCYYSDEGSNGYFDPEEYKEEISIGGENSFPEPYNEPPTDGNGSFPTRWLWTDNEDIKKEFNSEIQKIKQADLKEKQDAKQKREEAKIRKAKFKEIIKSKLTKEELKYINFK